VDKGHPKAFETIKDILCSTPILAVSNFDLLLEVDCNASGIGVGAVLTQAKRPLTSLSEKLNGLRHNCYSYDKEFYAIVRDLEHWSHCLKPNPFVLHSDHKALSCVNGQHQVELKTC